MLLAPEDLLLADTAEPGPCADSSRTRSRSVITRAAIAGVAVLLAAAAGYGVATADLAEERGEPTLTVGHA